MLYIGYVGFSVAFAFAVGCCSMVGLMRGCAGRDRGHCGLGLSGIGMALALWAYYELGWGGWWFWDPVENACFMPWLVGTALIHS